MTKALTLAISLLCLSSGCFAAEIIGAGNTSCGAYVTSYEKDIGGRPMSTMFDVTWTQGFLTGMNAYKSTANNGKASLVALPDSDSIRVYLYKYCRENPTNAIIYGGAQLFWKLEAEQSK